jgi:hypothetical protein
VQSGIETAPFYRSPIEDAVQIQGIVPCPVVVLRAGNISFVPDFLQLGQVLCRRGGKLSCFLRKR